MLLKRLPIRISRATQIISNLLSTLCLTGPIRRERTVALATGPLYYPHLASRPLIISAGSVPAYSNPAGQKRGGKRRTNPSMVEGISKMSGRVVQPRALADVCRVLARRTPPLNNSPRLNDRGDPLEDFIRLSHTKQVPPATSHFASPSCSSLACTCYTRLMWLSANGHDPSSTSFRRAICMHVKPAYLGNYRMSKLLVKSRPFQRTIPCILHMTRVTSNRHTRGSSSFVASGGIFYSPIKSQWRIWIRPFEDDDGLCKPPPPSSCCIRPPSQTVRRPYSSTKVQICSLATRG
ncbi:hypothetical protein F5X99DRAFT_316925 [Biscogniauxia marginata]|nr:hypothetical protein F5X99DRAFT_316925 [Biscogniauxia marginata]